MFGKPKPTVNVDEAVTAIMKFIDQDPMFAALVKGMMAGTALQVQAMTRALPEELRKKGASPELIAAATALQNMDVTRKVRELVLKK
jgi:hypothetical protein